MDQKIQYFTDLETWKVAHELVIDTYRVTDLFPPKEQFGLTSQIRRAAISITSNIAEGFSRYSYADKLRFYYMSRGSLSEAQNQLIVAKDLKYITEELFDALWIKSQRASALLNGLIKSTAGLSRS